LSVRVLGPLEVWRGDERVALGAAKQRALLGLLLVRRGEVGSDVVIDALWGDQPPKGARNTLQVYVSKLRRSLGHQVIETTPTGYKLRLEPNVVDADLFEQLFRETQNGSTASTEEKFDTLTEALSLWRGPAFADLRYEGFAQAESGRLDELRL